VDEPINSPEVTGSLRHTPDLPKRLTDLTPVVIVGTSAWVVALVVLFFVAQGVWVWTAFAGNRARLHRLRHHLLAARGPPSALEVRPTALKTRECL